MKDLKTPTRKISNDELRIGIRLSKDRDFDAYKTDFEDYVLDTIARLQDLKPGQQLRVGKELKLEDVGLTITVNGQTGELTDLRLRDVDRRDPQVSTEAVINGRIFKINSGELYVLTYPKA